MLIREIKKGWGFVHSQPFGRLGLHTAAGGPSHRVAADRAAVAALTDPHLPREWIPAPRVIGQRACRAVRTHFTVPRHAPVDGGWKGARWARCARAGTCCDSRVVLSLPS